MRAYRPLAVLPLLLAATLAFTGCRKPAPKQTEAQQARAVRVVRVEARSLAGSLAASGDLIPREEAAVMPEVNGYRVASVLVDVGDYVKKGQTLVQLDPTLIQAQIAQQTALVAQADAQATQAERNADRAKALGPPKGILSQADIDTRMYAAKAARATAEAQAAALRDIRTRAGKLAVTAPVAGLVLERNVRPGDMSSVGTTPWFRLARDGQIELAATMSEQDLARVREGQAATVTLPSGVTVTGHVRLVSPQINPQTKLGMARVLLPVSAQVRAGGFGRADFADASGAALSVPEAAVRYDADGASVMTVGADNRVHRALIQAGARGSGLVQLVKGPPAGTRVVANSASLLLDGDLIRPVEGAAPAAAAARR